MIETPTTTTGSVKHDNDSHSLSVTDSTTVPLITTPNDVKAKRFSLLLETEKMILSEIKENSRRAVLSRMYKEWKIEKK